MKFIRVGDVLVNLFHVSYATPDPHDTEKTLLFFQNVIEKRIDLPYAKFVELIQGENWGDRDGRF